MISIQLGDSDMMRILTAAVREIKAEKKGRMEAGQTTDALGGSAKPSPILTEKRKGRYV